MSKETVKINWKALTKHIHILSFLEIEKYNAKCKRQGNPKYGGPGKFNEKQWIARREKDFKEARMFLVKFIMAIDEKKEYEVILKEKVNETKF